MQERSVHDLSWQWQLEVCMVADFRWMLRMTKLCKLFMCGFIGFMVNLVEMLKFARNACLWVKDTLKRVCMAFDNWSLMKMWISCMILISHICTCQRRKSRGACAIARVHGYASLWDKNMKWVWLESDCFQLWTAIILASLTVIINIFKYSWLDTTKLSVCP